jgi:glycosyltransferase involved in cell wall biosynthesis
MDFSIIICTYNPDERIFKRVIEAVSKQDIPGNIEVECVIVDNNSDVPLSSKSFLQQIINENPWIKIIRESKAGLTNARIAGVSATTAPVIIFFDDDNEPKANYIKEVSVLIRQYQFVGVWGPGKIAVEFLDKSVSKWFLTQKSIFQERNFSAIEYGTIRNWQTSYPSGTGQIVLRKIINDYYTGIKSGQITLTDRKKDSLDSGGDIQILFCAIKGGFAVGVSPTLFINHIISEKKTTVQYIKRLFFGVGISYMPALTQIFPEEKNKIIPQRLWSILNRMIITILKNVTSWRNMQLRVAAYTSDVMGDYLALGLKPPFILLAIVKLFKLK